jgi:hypothetical protein
MWQEQETAGEGAADRAGCVAQIQNAGAAADDELRTLDDCVAERKASPSAAREPDFQQYRSQVEPKLGEGSRQSRRCDEATSLPPQCLIQGIGPDDVADARHPPSQSKQSASDKEPLYDHQRVRRSQTTTPNDEA